MNVLRTMCTGLVVLLAGWGPCDGEGISNVFHGEPPEGKTGTDAATNGTCSDPTPLSECLPCENGQRLADRYICLNEGEPCANSTLPCCTTECEDHNGCCFNPKNDPKRYLKCDKARDKCVLDTADAGPWDKCGAAGSWSVECPTTPTCAGCTVATSWMARSIGFFVSNTRAMSGGKWSEANGWDISLNLTTCEITMTSTDTTLKDYCPAVRGTYTFTIYPGITKTNPVDVSLDAACVKASRCECTGSVACKAYRH